MILFQILYLIVFLYFIVLILRLVFDWIQVFARDFPQRGSKILIVLVPVYELTDPPIRALRRLIPPLQIGSVRLDVAFVIVFVVVTVLMSVLRGLAA